MLGRPVPARSATRSATFGAYPRRIAPPSGFAWSPAFSVVENAPGLFTASLDASSLKVATSVNRYVNGARVDNSGGGTTPALAYRAIWAPINVLGAATTIYVLGSADRNNPTVYPAADAWLLPLVQSVNVIVVSDLTTLAPGWAVSSVESNPTAINGHSSVAVNLYVERLGFKYGHARAFFLQNVGTATFVDCDFTLGTTEGLSLNSSAASAVHNINLIRCRAYANQNGDGFPYTASGAGATVRVLEWECEAYSNAGASSQGSSGHFTAGNAEVSIIRVGGRYYGNGAQEVADVDCKTWMVGSFLNGVDAAGIGFTASGTGTAWLHGCVLTGNATDLTTDNAAGTINVSRTHYRTASGSGTVQTYQP